MGVSCYRAVIVAQVLVCAGIAKIMKVRNTTQVLQDSSQQSHAVSIIKVDLVKSLDFEKHLLRGGRGENTEPKPTRSFNKNRYDQPTSTYSKTQWNERGQKQDAYNAPAARRAPPSYNQTKYAASNSYNHHSASTKENYNRRK